MNKAPWRITYNTDYYDAEPEELERRYITSIIAADGKTVCYTDSGFFRMDADDARLIVAAPKMLEVLKRVEAASLRPNSELSRAVRAVIAKAESHD